MKEEKILGADMLFKFKYALCIEFDFELPVEQTLSNFESFLPGNMTEYILFWGLNYMMA